MQDTALLSAIAQRRDQDAFDQLCRRYAPRLLVFVRGRGVEDAESIVQEVMLTVWRRAELFDPHRAAPSTWIFTIARNRALDALRRRRRPTPNPLDPAFVAASTTTVEAPDTATDRSRRMAAVRREMAALPTQQQDVMSLVYLECSTIAEAAVQLGIPIGTAKSRLRLALNYLRTRMREPCHG